MTTSPSSPIGTPPCISTIEEFPLQAVSPVERRNSILVLSAFARETLANTEEFLPSARRGEKMYDALLRNAPLCQALKEIDPNIIRYVAQKVLSDKGVQKILSLFCSIKKLNLSGFSEITDSTLTSIAALKQLTVLNLSGTKVHNLRPLIEQPLKNLRTVNFYQTQLDFDSLIAFLQCHTITVLTLPKNPPKGFLLKIPMENLEQITLHVNGSKDKENSVTPDEIIMVTNKFAIRTFHVWLADIAEAYQLMIGVKRKRVEVVCLTDDKTVTIST